jgi:hypothetical protein
MNLNKYKKCIDFLFENNCQNIIHSHSNFLNHLIGTFNILKKWKQSEDVCFAGMFHNIYGNKYFNPNLNVSRETIKNIIGDSAENLVYKYVNCERQKINESNENELIILNLANSLDQKKLFIIEDNLYDKNSAKNVEEYFKSIRWSFDSSNLTDLSRKWNYNLDYKHDCEKTFLNISDMLLNKHGLNKVFKLSRSYASANNYGAIGEYHLDDGAKEYNEIITIMFYLNNNWGIDFGGETFFLNEKKDEIDYAIIPKPGRALIFDGFITHKPAPLNRNYNDLRMVLTFKYKLINS